MPTVPEPAAPDTTPSLAEYHAAFVADHIEATPEALPVGAADAIAATVDHLRAAVEVHDVFDAVAHEGRVVTDEERATLARAREVLTTDIDP